MRLVLVALAALSLLAAPARSLAQGGPWLTPEGAGGIPWGSSSQPVGAVPRPRDLYLPDSGYIGRSSADRPDDLELPGPHDEGERRFLRYVDGKLVDAWVLREGRLDTRDFETDGDEEWTGVVLGPADKGFRAFGIGRAWTMGDRTVLHWTDRNSATQVIASRARPTGAYGVERALPLEPQGAGRVKARIKGPLKDWLEPAGDYLSGCLEQAPKPVTAEVIMAYDDKGQPARIKVDTDQPAPAAVECFASAVVTTSAPPGTHGSVTVFRMR